MKPGASAAGAGPRRTCIGCRRVAPPPELMRIVAAPHGEIAIGRTLEGRGAWLCAGSTACIDAAARRKAFSRALRAEVQPDAVAALRSSVADRARMEESESSRSDAG